MNYEPGPDFALKMDAEDKLAGFRSRFHIPVDREGKETVYMCGNSLGPMPKAVPEEMKKYLDDWARLGVEGHWTEPRPWLPIHKALEKQMAAVVGGKPQETVVMGTLTSNLHLLMVSFYNPTPERYKILIESNAFPSDRYAVASQIRTIAHKIAPFVGGGDKVGFDAASAMVELQPRPGEVTLRTEDIEKVIEEQGGEIALIMIGGNNFYTGQTFDMARITKKGHEKGCMVGFDLAHSVGNVELKLHDWGVDFACWCPYKYLNSGAGGIGGIFVHERHHGKPDMPRFEGWWGNDVSSRFRMEHDISPFPTAEAWQVSNPPVFSMVPVKVSLDIFMEAGMDSLFTKRRKLTGYLEYLLNGLGTDAFKILTPSNPDERGAQLSIVMKKDGKKMFEALERQGIICDWREPDCIRVAPAPLFSRFQDVYKFAEVFARELGLGLIQKRAPGKAGGMKP